MNESVKIWIDIAKSDLKASKILYENKNFRTSYFFFQQSSEKSNKAFAFLLEDFSEKEAKKILHDQLKPFKKRLIKQSEDFSVLKNLLKSIPVFPFPNGISESNLSGYEESILGTIHFIDSLKNIDLVRLSSNELNNFLYEIEKNLLLKIKPKKKPETQIKNLLEKISEWMGEFHTDEAQKAKEEILVFINDELKLKELVEIMTAQFIPMLFELNFIFFTFFYCAIVTIQHSSRARYPENGVSPDDIYKKNLPIVKKQIEFMDYLELALKKLEKINLTCSFCLFA